MQRDADIIRKEQIEEMTKLIQTKEIHPCDDDAHCEDCYCACKGMAEMIYNAGYRKADDVRKETAKEVLNDLYYNLQVSVQEKISKSNDYYNILGWIEEIAKEYGVEVEEWK